MTPDQLLNSSPSFLATQATYTLRSEDVGRIKQAQLKDLQAINLESVQFGETVKLDALQQVSAIKSETMGPRLISNQILIEPLKAISPDAVVNQTIGANATLSEAISSTTSEKVEKIAALSQNPSSINNAQLKACVNSASKKCASVVEEEAKQSEFAHGHVLQSSATTATLAANGLRFHSDTTIATRTPHWAVTSQDYHVQANNSIVAVSDVHLTQTKQSVSFVEGAHLIQAQSGMIVSTQTQDVVSKQLRNTGVEQYTSMGKVHQSVADQSMTQLSGGTLSTVAYDNIQAQSGGSISLLASPAPKLEESVHASGSPSNNRSSAGQILFTAANTQAQLSVVSLSEQGILSSTEGSIIQSATKTALLAGQQTINFGSRSAYIGTEIGGLIVSGRRVLLNTLPISIQAPAPLKIQKLPSLPSIPQIPQEKLESCLPKSVTEPDSSSNVDLDKPIVVLNPDSSIPGTERRSPRVEVIPKSRSATNPKQSPRLLGKQTSNAQGTLPSKLPGTSAVPQATSSTNQTATAASALLDTGALSGASTNIYLEREQSSEAGIVELMQTLSRTQESISINDLVNDKQLVDFLRKQALSQFSQVTPALIQEFLGSSLPSGALLELNQPLVFQALAQIDSQRLVQDLKPTDFVSGTDQNIIQTGIRIWNTYSAQRSDLIRLLQHLSGISAIGFLGSLSGIFSTLRLPDLSSIVNLPAIVTGNIGAVALPFLTQLSSKLGLDKLLSGSVFQLGQALISGDSTQLKTMLDRLIQEKLQAIVGNQVTALPILQEVLSQIQSGKPFSEKQLFSFLQQALGSSDLNRIQPIYDQVQPLIQSVQQGDLLSLVNQGSLSSLLTSVLGEKNSGTVSRVFEILRKAVGTYQAFAALPRLIDLMNRYKIPALDQIGIALDCLDLFNQVQELVQAVRALSSDTETALPNTPAAKETARLMEYSGRLVQLGNTLEQQGKLPDYLKLSAIDLDPCFRLPRLTLAEAEVNVLEVKNSTLKFELTNLDLLADFLTLPQEGSILQLYVEGFQTASGNVLIPYQTDFQYTPSIYNYWIQEFDLEQNIGIAVLQQTIASLVLETSEGTLLEYPPEAIGRSLFPVIVESYILA